MICYYGRVDSFLASPSLLLLLAFVGTGVHNGAMRRIEGCAFHAAVWFGGCGCTVQRMIWVHAALTELRCYQFHVSADW